MIGRLLALVLLAATPAWASGPIGGEVGLPPCTADNQVVMCEGAVQTWRGFILSPDDFFCDAPTGVCVIDPSIPRCGALLGAASCWRQGADGGADLSGSALKLPQASSTIAADCDDAAEQERLVAVTGGNASPLRTCRVTGDKEQWADPAGRYQVLGGDGSDGDFFWLGDATCATVPTGFVSDDCCRNGTKSSTSCILNYNSYLGYYGNDALTPNSCVYNFRNFNTGGTSWTITCGASGAYSATGAPQWGSTLALRIAGTATFAASTLGVFDMIGKGAAGGAGGPSGTAGNRNGGAGGFTLWAGGAGGIGSSTTAPTVGVATPTDPRLFPLVRPFLVGAGGGGGAGSNAPGGSAGLPLTLGGFGLPALHPSSGATGGGGGYCTSSAGTSSTGGAGGRGGGGILIEVAGKYETPNTIAVSTNASNGAAGGSGGAGGGGGGGGISVVYAREIGTDSATYTAPGGNGGAVGTNCSVGAAGAAGQAWRRVVPR